MTTPLEAFEARRDFLSDLTDAAGLVTCESFRAWLRRFDVRLELLLDAVDRLRFLERVDEGL